MKTLKIAIPAFVVAAIIGISFCTASSTTKPPPSISYPSKVTFLREIHKNGQASDFVEETYPWGTQRLPSHRIAKPGYGFLHHTFATPKPVGAKKQVISFRFRSNDLFKHNPDAHFLISGRSESTSWYNRGRGFIVGGLDSTVNPCQGFMTSQPESWWTLQPNKQEPASTVWNGSHCGPEMRDGVWYNVDLHLDNKSNFSYWIWENKKLVTSQLVHDAINPEGEIINEKLTGFAFGLVFARNYNEGWSLEFDEIKIQWL